MHTFEWLNTTFNLFGLDVKWSDFFGNILALATVVLALKRWMIAWPVQIVGSILLLTATLATHLPGNAARQVVIILAAFWGWSRWKANKAEQGTITVRWATHRQRGLMIAVMVLGSLAFGSLLKATNASFYYGAPWHIVLSDAWIFVGSVMAMYAQARRIVEFWFVWLAVDLVGVPLAWTSGLYFSGMVYGVFFVMVLIGIRDWASRSKQRISSPMDAAVEVEGATAETATTTAHTGSLDGPAEGDERVAR